MREEEETNPAPVPIRSAVHLTPLRSRHGNVLDWSARIFLTELRLLLKGVSWWWYLIALGLMVTGLLAPTDISRQYFLPAAWIWPILLWSSLGTREKRHDTGQLVFSAPHPLSRQFPLAWLAGVAVTLVTGAGVGINLIMAGDWLPLTTWGIGVFFIPTLAFALGVWSGTNKLFEVVYMLWWYAGPVNRTEPLDFMGASSAVDLKHVMFYGLLPVVLFALAVLGRSREIRG